MPGLFGVASRSNLIKSLKFTRLTHCTLSCRAGDKLKITFIFEVTVLIALPPHSSHLLTHNVVLPLSL